MGGFIADTAKRVFGGNGGGSQVSHEMNANRAENIAQSQEWANQVAKEEQQRKHQGFMESMGGWSGNVSPYARADRASMPVAPPPQWAYVQGQGPVWQTPERIGASTEYTMVNNAPGTPGFYGGGNRI